MTREAIIYTPVAVVVELVVRSEGEECADADAVGVEDLGAAVDPALAHGEALPVGGEEVPQPVHGAVQGERLDRQDREDAVREEGGEPEDLQEILNVYDWQNRSS